MREGAPSRTAQWTAELRAAHQIYDDPKILVDPLAVKILGEDCEKQIRANPAQYATLINRKLRTMFVARSRFCEDAMVAAVARGVEQLVILGAGLDTFAFRNTPAVGVKVFEFDHPATQAWKRSRLAAAGIVVPQSVVFAPVDFAETTLAEGLTRHGVDLSRPMFLSWLGVLVYLDPEVALSTLRFVGSALPPASEIVFDYLVPVETLGVTGRHASTLLSKRAADLGEPWRTFFKSDELSTSLQQLGFAVVKDVDAEIYALELGGVRDGLPPLGLTRLMRAIVGGRLD